MLVNLGTKTKGNELPSGSEAPALADFIRNLRIAVLKVSWQQRRAGAENGFILHRPSPQEYEKSLHPKSGAPPIKAYGQRCSPRMTLTRV